MIISKVRMKNFRGFSDKTIDFLNKPVVLLSASNGLGKTTTIDAIEWCLTGNIGRLKNAFDLRSPNSDDRKMNTDGILKNRDTDEDDLVEVALWLFDGEKEIELCRIQKKDELNPKNSKVVINGSEKEAARFINSYVGESFYNYHFCDVQKSFNVQSTKRGDLESLFSDFITDYTSKLQIATSIDVFAEDASRYIEDNEQLKVAPEIINTYETQLDKVKEKAKQIIYPNISFYEGEKTNITELTKEELKKQKVIIEKCGYLAAEISLRQLCENEELKNEITTINSITIFRADNKEELKQAKISGLFDDTDVISLVEEDIKKYKALSLNKDTIFSECESINLFKRNDSFYQDFIQNKKIILEKENSVTNISSEIDLLSSNNSFLKLLANFSANKQLVVEYRNNIRSKKGVVKCPICGSEAFSKLDDSLILSEADEYIRRNGELVKKKEIDKTILQSEIEELYKKVISEASSFVSKELGLLEEKKEKLKALKSKLNPYFDLVRKLQKVESKVFATELDDIKLDEFLLSVKARVLTDAQEKKEIELYQKTLDVLGYNYANDTLPQTHAKVKGMLDTEYEVSNYSYDVFVSKINAIDSLLSNQEKFDLENKINEAKEKNKRLTDENEKLHKLHQTAIEKAQEIRSIVEELSKAEYENVGPALNKFYNKLIRVDNSDGIKIIHEKDGISLVDNKGKNIVNVLSNGQICVFMLAYFFAGINARNDKEKMKVFFIDDLTACMDDVNMLAFMDLLKYQMDAKATMEQLFFVTCDNRISDLLKYKLAGRGIELCELMEEDFVK